MNFLFPFHIFLPVAYTLPLPIVGGGGGVVVVAFKRIIPLAAGDKTTAFKTKAVVEHLTFTAESGTVYFTTVLLKPCSCRYNTRRQYR
jgi:formate hydrogenlyase subunit 3/multisubunit Na+/H+ antiporter MnhD subunit